MKGYPRISLERVAELSTVEQGRLRAVRTAIDQAEHGVPQSEQQFPMTRRASS